MQLSTSKRLVIKLGSSLLVDDETGEIHHVWLNNLINEIAEFWRNGMQIIIVSSGAIALGRRVLKQENKKLSLEIKQAAAAIGQIKLSEVYQSCFAAQGISVGQILLTLDDSENRRRYINAQNTIETLLKFKVIPIINENDSVATAEIRFGDNDRLAARVAQMIKADTLALLSDINGLYTANPKTHAHAKLICEVTELTPEILAMGSDSSTPFGSGGMITKLAAAKIALASGCKMVIAQGKRLNPLRQIDETSDHTWFIPQTTPLTARKNWIAQHLKPKGQIFIDAGASAALLQGKSLLSVGIINIEGDFHKGDAVCIFNKKQEEIARGLINYNAQDAKKIKGLKSEAYEDKLGYCGNEEIIHRDNLTLFKSE